MTAVIATPPFLAFFDLNGNPLAGGLVYTYAAGTVTPKATYTDQGALTPQVNPIVLDSAGRATWWITGAYKYIIKDALGNTIATTDNVTSFNTLATAGSAFFQSFSGDGSTTAFTLSTDEGTDSKGLMVFVNSGLISYVTNGTFTSDTGWTKGAGWTIATGTAIATGAISTAISQTSPITLVQGQAYSITYTITVSAGTLTPSLGGNNGITRSTAGTFQETIVAGSTQITAFTGAGFTGTLDNVTINVASGAGFDILNPNTYTISGTALTFAQAPATGTNNIFVFAPSSLLGAASSAAALAQTYATQALTSQTAAAISASSAAGYAAAKNQWTYSTTTTMADPGTGLLRFNNATLASATAMAISDLSANSGNPDLTTWLATWDDSTSSPRGQLQIFKDNGNFVIYNITGANGDNTGWKQIVLTYIAGAGSFSNNDSIFVGFTAFGITTVTGAGTLGLQNANATAITGGTINGTTIGGVTAAVGTFSNLNTTGTGGGAAVVFSDTTNAGGSNIQLSGNGVTTPNKFIRAASGNLDFLNNAYTVVMTLSDAGKLTGTAGMFSPITNSLSGDVNLNNTAAFFDGPSIAQGTSGTWFVSGNVTLLDTSTAVYSVKLWDGTTVVASTLMTGTANFQINVALSGFITSPAANLKISVSDISNTSGKIKFNLTGNSKDSTITAIRIA